MGNTYYYPNRTQLSSSGLRACLYDEECPGFTSCINNECIMPYLPGHTCKIEPSKGPFLGLKKDVMPGEDEGGCINLTCDSFTRTCQFEDKKQEEDSYAAISCTMDGDCPYQHACDFVSGMCLKLPTLGESCTGACIKPYVCYQGMCRQPCFSDYDCYIGSERTDTTIWACMTVYNACTITTEGTRPSETELDLFFGKVPKSFTEPDPSEAKPEKPASSSSTTTSQSTQPSNETPSNSPEPTPSQDTGSEQQSSPISSKLPASNSDQGADADSSAADKASAEGAAGDNSQMIMIGAAAGGALLLLILIVIIWRVIKKRRSSSSTISTSSYGKKMNYPAQAPAYVPTMSPSTTSDYKDPNFGMKSNSGPTDAPPVYRH